MSIPGAVTTMSSESPAKIKVTINGEVREVGARLSISRLLGELGIPATRVAIEYNREILKKEFWDKTVLAAGDNLEVVVSLAEQDADWDAAWVAREVLDTAEDTHSLREMRNLLGDLRALERHLA